MSSYRPSAQGAPTPPTGAPARRATISIDDLIDLCDDIIIDLKEEVKQLDDKLLGKRNAADPARGKAYAVARVWTEGNLDQAEDMFRRELKALDGKPFSEREPARERLLKIWADLKRDPAFRNALLNRRHNIRAAQDEVAELDRQRSMLTDMWHNAYQAKQALTQSLENGVRRLDMTNEFDRKAEHTYQRRIVALVKASQQAMSLTGGTTPAPAPE